MKALYRKYRPTKLSEVVGQDQVIKPLENSLKSGNFSHAFLFTGPRGCGKTSVARILAHEINNFKYQIEDMYADIVEIDAASNTGVDNIRDLIEKTMIAPSEGKYKVYIIDEVHMLSKSAFNALLKTLEEPPKHVVFIMATTDAYKVPITITSRSQVYNFQLAAPDVMMKHLKSIAEKEKIKISDEALELIVQKGGGSFRDSISLLDQISNLADKTTEIDFDLVRDSLGLPEEQKVQEILDCYEAGNLDEIIQKLQDFLNTGIKAETLAQNFITRIVQQPRPSYISLLSRLVEVKGEFPEAKLLLAFTEDFATQPAVKIVQKNTVSSSEAKVVKQVSETNDATEEAKGDSEKDNEKTEQPAEITFSWDEYFEAIHQANTTLSMTLKKCKHHFANNVLSIYPTQKIQRAILSSEKNLDVLIKNLPSGVKLDITDQDFDVKNTNDYAKISDIMGTVQEVNTDGVPFK